MDESAPFTEAYIVTAQQKAAETLAEASITYIQAAILCATLDAAVLRLRSGDCLDVEPQDVVRHQSVRRSVEKCHEGVGAAMRERLRALRKAAAKGEPSTWAGPITN